MGDVWIVGIVGIAILLYIIVFYSININYPKWRKYKYIVPVIIFLVGSILMSIGTLVIMNLSLIVCGTVLLIIAVSGGVVGFVVDFFTRSKTRYR